VMAACDVAVNADTVATTATALVSRRLLTRSRVVGTVGT
jgi:hypothetical protein